MQQAHATGGVLLLGAIVLFLAVALVLTFTGGMRPWLETLRKVMTGLVAVQVGIGALLYAMGQRPAETLHLLYGAVALGVLPFASTFSSEAPPKARAGVISLGAVLTLGLLFRALSTGD